MVSSKLRQEDGSPQPHKNGSIHHSTAVVAVEEAARDRLAPFNPTGAQAQAKALELLQLTDNDVLFDLGCGDARLLIAAAQQVKGLRCVGLDMDPVFVAKAQEAVAAANLAPRVDIRQENLMNIKKKNSATAAATTVSSSSSSNNNNNNKLTLQHDATAVYLYLLPQGLARIKQAMLDDLVQQQCLGDRPLRIVTYMFRLHGWEPAVVDESTKGQVRLYLYQFNC